MSLMAEKYRRHMSKLKSPIIDAAVKESQLILMSARNAMMQYSLLAPTSKTCNVQGSFVMGRYEALHSRFLYTCRCVLYVKIVVQTMKS
jgi:hypothetical protein